jgi:hypothetical protein
MTFRRYLLSTNPIHLPKMDPEDHRLVIGRANMILTIQALWFGRNAEVRAGNG